MQSRLKVVNWGILNKQFRTLVQLGQIQKATFKWTVALQYFSEIENIYEKRCYLSKLSQTLKKMKHNSFKAKFANYLKYQDKKADIFCALLVLLIPWDIFSISGGRNEWIFSFCGVPAQRSIGREKCRSKTYFLLHSIIEMNDSGPSSR